MASLDLLFKAWDVAHWEFTLAFEGLSDEDLWKRPHPRLLSVGELAGHLAYWEAVGVTPAEAGGKVDLEHVSIKSPLVDNAFRYYTNSENSPASLPIGCAEVLQELKRVHEEAKAEMTKNNPDSADIIPGFKENTYGQVMEYRVFHVAYHTGQAYSVRHLLGHTTTDN